MPTRGEGLRYYSANGEDFLLWEFFGHGKQGSFVDVGAFDGVHFSNSYSFELAGWRGLCAEPNPLVFPLLSRNRPRSVCVQRACVADPKLCATLFLSEELGLLSTTSPPRGYEEFVAGRYRKRGLPFHGLHRAMVAAATLDQLIERHAGEIGEADFVSIDVEGAELEVLRGFDLERHAPRVLVVESNTPDFAKEIVAFVAGHGYRLAGRLVENLFFARTEADCERLRSFRVSCRIEPQLHPLGERFTPEPYRLGRKIDDARPNRLTR